MKNVSAGPFDSGNTATIMSQRIELSKNISNFQNISSICTTPSIAVKIATLAYPPGFFGPIIGVLTANFLYKHKFSTKPWPLVVVSAYFFSVVPFMPFFSMDYKKFETDTYWIYLSIGVFFSSMRMGLDQDFTNRLIKYSKRGTAFAVKYWTGKIVLMFLVYAAGVMVQNDTIDRIDRKLVELNSDRMSDMEYQIIRFRAMQKALMTTLPTMFVSIIFYAGGYIFYDIDDPDDKDIKQQSTEDTLTQIEEAKAFKSNTDQKKEDQDPSPGNWNSNSKSKSKATSCKRRNCHSISDQRYTFDH